MNNFSLSRPRAKVLPESLTGEDGNEYSIDADFRTVLRCIRVCTDPDIEPKDALYMLIMWFFGGKLVPNALELFLSFVSTENGEETDPALMDFEQDADAIFASFMTDYGIDLIDIPFLHWYKFQALLGGLSEKTALHSRIQLRELDTSHLKGKDKLKAEKAKRRVQLIERISAEEEALCEELETALAEGKDPTEVLAKLKKL